MYTKKSMHRQHLSLLAALLILIMSVSAPTSVFASESSDAGTESAADISTQSSAASSTQSAADEARTDSFHYQHNPMENPNAAKDIVVNPEAVYGYSPSPDSVRLKQYVDAIDWTDADAVAAGRKEREEYHESMSALYRMIEDMLGQGKNVEEIARAVSKTRNEIRLTSYDGDPEGLEIVKKSNLDTYGQGNRPDGFPHHFLGDIGHSHQTAAFAGGGYFMSRASHVQINSVKAPQRLHTRGRLGNDIRLPAEELENQLFLLRVPDYQILNRALARSAEIPHGADHFRIALRAAHLRTDAPENMICNAAHGCKSDLVHQ